VQLVFLAAVAVFAATFLSFPVACLLCFGLLPFSMATEFLADSVKLPRDAAAGASVLTYVAHYIVKVMTALLPDFTKTSPAEALVGGMQIGWGAVAAEAGWSLALRAALGLLLACLIFRKRELAWVQV